MAAKKKSSGSKSSKKPSTTVDDLEEGRELSDEELDNVGGGAKKLSIYGEPKPTPPPAPPPSGTFWGI